MAQGNLIEEFPGYPVDSVPPMPAGFDPNHWHNDASPSWTCGNLVLWVAHPDPEQREFECARFCLQTDDDKTIIESDDWAEIIAAVAKVQGE